MRLGGARLAAHALCGMRAREKFVECFAQDALVLRKPVKFQAWKGCSASDILGWQVLARQLFIYERICFYAENYCWQKETTHAVVFFCDDARNA